MTRPIVLLFLCLCAAGSAWASPGAGKTARDYLDMRCHSMDAGPQACSCVREAFAANVADTSPDPETTRHAAMLFAAGAMTDPADRAEFQSLSPAAQNRAAKLMTTGVLAQMQQCLVSGVAKGMAQKGMAPPPPETPEVATSDPDKAAFLARCRKRFDKPGACTCLAGQGAAKLSPEEFDLLVAFKRGMAGKADMGKVAQSHGVTRHQLFQIIGQSDRLSGAMMSVSLLACGAM